MLFVLFILATIFQLEKTSKNSIAVQQITLK